jgi:hypothetical protein
MIMVQRFYREVKVECLINDIVENVKQHDRNVIIKLMEPFTVHHLIEILEIKFPKLKKRIKNREGQYYSYVVIVINGREIVPMTENFKELNTGDEISLMYLCVGG